jgi:deferrochelatase/peroxidase EfeB
MRKGLSRRQLLAGSGLATAGLIAGAAGAAATGTGAERAGAATTADGSDAAPTSSAGGGSTVPFFGDHQAGITTPEQARMVFAAFDLTATGADALEELLTRWTRAAALLTAGQPVEGPAGTFVPPADTGEALGLPASNLTVTVGFGPTLFDGRFGLGAKKPAALAELPPFAGDQLDATRSGGDLCIQACADDAQVAFHAVHNLARVALGTATLRYLQTCFGRAASPGSTGEAPRNLLGFRDGTNNLDPSDAAAMREFVWVERASTDQPWMVGGSYLVARRIRIHLEEWDRNTLDVQQHTIGRVKATGAPLGQTGEHAPLDLQALGPDAQPVIPEYAHIRQAAPTTNDGQAILRRGYSFADGVDPQSGELDAGLFFVCFQKDPRKQYVPIQARLSLNDALGEYLVPTGSAVFACPPGVADGDHWGRDLL